MLYQSCGNRGGLGCGGVGEEWVGGLEQGLEE